MDDVNGNSSMAEITTWLGNINKEIQSLAAQAETNPSDETLTKAKTLLNNAKALVNEKIKALEEEKNPNKAEISTMFSEVITEMDAVVSKIVAKNDTNNNASMALS